MEEKAGEKVEEEEFELPEDEEEGTTAWDYVNFEPFPFESTGCFASKSAARKEIPKGGKSWGTLDWDPVMVQSLKLDSPTFGDFSGISRDAEHSNDDDDNDGVWIPGREVRTLWLSPYPPFSARRTERS